MKIVIPYHCKVYERKGTRWFARDAARVFYNSTNVPLDIVNTEQKFGLTAEQVIINASTLFVVYTEVMHFFNYICLVLVFCVLAQSVI